MSEGTTTAEDQRTNTDVATLRWQGREVELPAVTGTDARRKS